VAQDQAFFAPCAPFYRLGYLRCGRRAEDRQNPVDHLDGLGNWRDRCGPLRVGRLWPDGQCPTPEWTSGTVPDLDALVGPLDAA
jgi:hypothetical protein